MSPTTLSDKENTATQAGRVDKGKGRMPPPSSTSRPGAGSQAQLAAKRKRVEQVNGMASKRQSRSRNNGSDEEVEAEDKRFYDPGQDETERRGVKRQSRALEREFNGTVIVKHLTISLTDPDPENRDDYLKHGSSGLQKTIMDANAIFENVKQTSDATLDSRLMVSVSDLAYKKSAQLVLDDTSTGIDVDEFVSKCIVFMKRAPGPTRPSATQARRHADRDDDADEDEDNVLDWEKLGREACFPHNIRPAVPGFLLGPLSVQKRVRAPTQRRAREARNAGGQEVRPEALTKEDLATNDDNTVRTLCSKIKSRLERHCNRAMAAVEAAVGEAEDDELVATEMRRNRLCDTGGPMLLDFVINPKSFGQTVENLFYVSFLIKEGEVGLEIDGQGYPTLLPSTETMLESRERRATKHQAVLGLDYHTFRRFVAAFEIKEPLIPHRQTEQDAQVGSRGWYN